MVKEQEIWHKKNYHCSTHLSSLIFLYFFLWALEVLPEHCYMGKEINQLISLNRRKY
jgi:hypothetical protein